MWRWLISLCLTSAVAFSTKAQELFIVSEPASSVPHKSLIVRGFTQWYDEFGAIRGMGAVSFYYGLTPRLSVRLMVSGSNHHGEFLPENLVTHRHVGNRTIFFTQAVDRSNPYPFLVQGINASFKYRFLSIDGHREHFRAAVTGMYSTAQSAHDEAEANLLDDNSGFAGGLILTYLHQRTAISFNYQYIVPDSYEETNNGQHMLLDYGHTQQFSLSLGYLLSPKEYEAFEQTNTNIYLELFGKVYQGVDIYQNAELLPVENPGHYGSYWVEIQPGIQKVYNSRTLLEFSMGFPLLRSSFAHATPTYLLSIRRYLYL